MNTDITLIRYATEVVGEGPTLHVHPYDEIFTIIEGRARFTVGDKTIDAAGGDVVLGPANIPHGYQNLGPGKLDSLDIHLSPEGIQDNLADGWDKSSIFISADSKVSPAGASKQKKNERLLPEANRLISCHGCSSKDFGRRGGSPDSTGNFRRSILSQPGLRF